MLSTGLLKLSSSILSCDGAGGIICVLWFGARLVVENKLSPGELSTFVIYAVYVGSNVGQLAGVVSSLVQVPLVPLLHPCCFLYLSSTPITSNSIWWLVKTMP